MNLWDFAWRLHMKRDDPIVVGGVPLDQFSVFGYYYYYYYYYYYTTTTTTTTFSFRKFWHAGPTSKCFVARAVCFSWSGTLAPAGTLAHFCPCASVPDRKNHCLLGQFPSQPLAPKSGPSPPP